MKLSINFMVFDSMTGLENPFFMNVSANFDVFDSMTDLDIQFLKIFQLISMFLIE